MLSFTPNEVKNARRNEIHKKDALFESHSIPRNLKISKTTNIEIYVRLSTIAYGIEWFTCAKRAKQCKGCPKMSSSRKGEGKK